jgi:hypothetical protein
MQTISEILSIQDAAIKLANRVIFPNSNEYIFTRAPVVKGFTHSGSTEQEDKGNTSESVQKAREAVRLAKTAQDLVAKLLKLVASCLLNRRSALTGGIDDENHGEQTHVNIIEAELCLTEHYKIQFESVAANANSTVQPQTKLVADYSVQTGLTKQPVINALEDVYWSRDQWSKYLASPPQWLIDCRVAKGTKTVSATWNPTSIGLALIDKGITLKRLDLVFMGLKDWKDEWQKKTDLMR